MSHQSNRNASPESFKKAFASLTMPDETRASIRAANDREREGQPGRRDLSVIDGAASRPLITRRRVLAVAACTGLVAIGGVALGTYLAGRPGAGHPDAAAAGDGFVLRAYADGTPLAKGRDVIASNKIITGLDSSWSEGDGDDRGRMTYRIAWGIDLAYLGRDVERVEFSLPRGEAVKLTWSKPSGSAAGKSPDWGEGSSVTIDRSGRAAASTSYSLSFFFPSDDEIQRAHDAYEEKRAAEETGAGGDEPSVDEALDAYRYATFLKAARILAEAPLTARATLSSGETVSHVYRISPVEDFVRQGLANEREFWDAVVKGKSEDKLARIKEDQSPLFTIEQLS